MFKAVISFSVLIILLAVGIAVDRHANAQSPEEFVKYQAAGSLTATIGTKPSADGKTQVPDPDKIVVCVRKFDSFAGTKGGPQCNTFSKAGIIADRQAMIAEHAAKLAAMDAAIAAIKAAQ